MFRSTISAQDRDLVMMVRDLVRQEIAPKAVVYDAQGNENFDWSAIDLLAEHNLLAPSISPEYGGRGLSHLSAAMIVEEIAVACAGVAASAVANMHAVSPLVTSGTETQRQEVLPLLTSGKACLGSLAMTENRPNLNILVENAQIEIINSSVTGFWQEGCLILNGFKDYVLNGQVASFITLLVTLDGPEKKTGLQIVVIPLSLPGIRTGAVRQKIGLKYCNSCEVIFENVKVEPRYIVGKPGSGFLIFMQNLDRMVPYVGAMSLGVARAAYETALAIAKKRYIMGRPSFEETAISFALVDMAAQLNAARQSVYLASWLIDQELDSSQASSKAKILSTRAAHDISSKAMEIVGGRAYVKGYPSEIYLRDAEMLSIIDGSEQFHKSLIAAQL
ncbi:MAG TPA: acyl-CoA dehydrogenase family protein [Syntrophomonas sp.]|nr:acyl-CoA dehydrogenase family protein [Syntrophomonas sp.]HRW12459.1 acyl-CoA dehydrogenase family protein [Syntrophomonas sp.]